MRLRWRHARLQKTHRAAASTALLPWRSIWRPVRVSGGIADPAGSRPSPPLAQQFSRSAQAESSHNAGNWLDHSIGRVRNCGNEPYPVPRSYFYLSIENVQAQTIRLCPQSVRAGISSVCPNGPTAEEAAFEVIIPITCSQYGEQRVSLPAWLRKMAAITSLTANRPLAEECQSKTKRPWPRSSQRNWGSPAEAWCSGCGHTGNPPTQECVSKRMNAN